MNRNMQETKSLLKKAFQNIPEDFSLREIRFAISSVLQKIEQYESKTEKRIERKQEQVKKLHVGDLKVALDAINKMIDEEKKVIDEIRNVKPNNETLNG